MAVGTYAITSLANLKTYLGIDDTTDDTFLEQCIDRATAFVESYLDYKVMSRELYEWHDGQGGRRLVLNNPNVTSVHTVRSGIANAMVVSGNVAGDIGLTISIVDNVAQLQRTASNGTETTDEYDLTNASYLTTNLLAASIESKTGWSASASKNVKTQWLHNLGGVDVVENSYNLTYANNSEQIFRVDHKSGVIYLRRDPNHIFDADLRMPHQLPTTRQSLFVNYTAGYIGNALPNDIEQACIEAASSMYKQRDHDSNVASESLGDYSYSLRGPADLLDSIQRLLEPYRSIR